MKLNAYAKINLTLDITGVRPDGFHELRSVMAPVTLCDVIELNKNGSFAFDCSVKELCGTDNLCVRAAKLFFELSGQNPNVSIYLEKNIPFPAGLGGGSADATCVLKGLNELFGMPLSAEQLFSLAERLGSDVPFCLLGAPALCEGRGERLTSINSLPELDIVIAIGKARLKTPEVFREYDKARLPARADSDRLLNAIERGDREEVISSLGNAFEPITDILAPETKEIRKLMLSHSALNARLSGSGPSVYGVFENSRAASNCAEALKNIGIFAVCCKTVSK